MHALNFWPRAMAGLPKVPPAVILKSYLEELFARWSFCLSFLIKQISLLRTIDVLRNHVDCAKECASRSPLGVGEMW